MTKAMNCSVILLGSLALFSTTSCGRKTTEEEREAKVGARGSEGKKGAKSGEANALPQKDLAKAEPGSEPGDKKGNVVVPEKNGPLACGDDEHWEAQELKALKTGALEVAVEGFDKPSPKWVPCGGGRDHCERLDLSENQKLLAVGSHGNKVKLAIGETCGDNMSVVVGPPDAVATVAIRGVDMSFDSGAIGGDRFLLGGFARHRSDKAKDGFVPREYLVTGREGKTLKLEPARNKLKAVPYAAASQIVQVRYQGKQCTTMFWKLGISQCDFEGPKTEHFVILGSNMIYQEGTKGMAWNAKEGSRELLSQLDWIVSDGVNVAWSQEEQLFTQQVPWNLPTLRAEPVPGAPGPRPLAMGCGRMLSQGEEGYLLRNIKKGTQWILGSSRFPDDKGQVAAMDCEWVVFDSGYRISLKSPGEMTQLADPKAPAKDGSIQKLKESSAIVADPIAPQAKGAPAQGAPKVPSLARPGPKKSAPLQ